MCEVRGVGCGGAVQPSVWSGVGRRQGTQLQGVYITHTDTTCHTGPSLCLLGIPRPVRIKLTAGKQGQILTDTAHVISTTYHT